MPDKRLRRTKRELWRVAFACRSIAEAIKACDHVIANVKSVDDPVCYPLTAAIFVLYARPFGDNQGVGMISPKVLKLDSDEKRNLHDMLIHGRNKFYAHVDAETEYFDHKDVPVDRLLKLLVNVKDMQDGTAELDAGVTEPQLTLETVPRIKALCEELLKALNVEKKDLLKCLVEAGYKLKIGQNVLTLE